MASRNEGIIALLMILILIAFVMGSAIGIFMSINKQDNQTHHENNDSKYKNVTVEFTSNVNKNKSTVQDYDSNSIDSNKSNIKSVYN